MRSNLQDLKERFVLNADTYTTWTYLSRRHMTAMDAAALSTERSINSIMKRKYSDYVVDNKAVDWGKKREAIILAQFNLEQNRDMFHAQGHDRYLAMPDAIFEKDGQLAISQVKTTVKDFKKIPKRYMRQVQWETFVAGASGCLFVWEVHENDKVVDLKSVWVERNEEMIKHLVEVGQVLLKTLDKALDDPSPYLRPVYERSWY
jgi:hypothetical protein